MAPTEGPTKHVTKARESFAAVDLDGDGHLTKEELDKAAAGDEKAKKTKDRLVALFNQSDTNGDGSISISEMKTVFKKINTSKSGYTDIDVELAFINADRNQDGRLDIEEFIGWITGTGAQSGNGVRDAMQGETMKVLKKDTKMQGPEKFFYDKSTYTGSKAEEVTTASDRNERLKAEAPQESADEGDWQEVSKKFFSFAGKDGCLTGAEFAKLIKDCKLFNKKFVKEDVDSVFAKVVSKGQRNIAFDQFKNALRIVATKRGCHVNKVQELIAGSSGPVISATKAEANKFHDDKSMYTGVHAKGGPSTVDDSHNLMDQCRAK